tara:strand:- start:43 stop:501 length:459 start_codon:yes stop_codon:yes gene_type:complete
MIKSIKLNKSRSKFSELIREDGDRELNEILVKYNFTLNKLMKLDDAMNDANVKLSNSRGRSLFNKYREYKDLREMHLELVKLRKKRKNNKKVIMLLEYLDNFLQKSQTGDVLSQKITTYTEHGNLIEKIIKQNRGKGKKQNKTKKNKIKQKI